MTEEEETGPGMILLCSPPVRCLNLLMSREVSCHVTCVVGTFRILGAGTLMIIIVQVYMLVASSNVLYSVRLEGSSQFLNTFIHSRHCLCGSVVSRRIRNHKIPESQFDAGRTKMGNKELGSVRFLLSVSLPDPAFQNQLAYCLSHHSDYTH